MKTKLQLIWKIRIAFGAAVSIFLLVCAISYRAAIVSGESHQWVRHTHEVLDNLQNSLLEMQSMESSYRGFLLTGSNEYLGLFQASILHVQQSELTLGKLTEDNARQQRQLPALHRLAKQKAEFGEVVIGLRRTRGMEAAADAVRTGSGQQIMDQFQGIVREMQDEELRLLALREADAERHSRQSKVALILGGVSGLMIAVVLGWIVQRDYDASRRVEAAFLESEERFRFLVEGVRDYAIFTLDPGGKVVSWNAGAERIKGYKAEEIIGHNFSRFYLQADIDLGKPEAELQIAAASGRSEIEHWRVRKDGSRFWANVVITAARDSSGRLLGFSEISRDISDRKETEAKYRGLLEAAPDAMVVVNVAGEIVLLNVQAEKQFGYARDELLGQPVKNIIPEGFAERLVADDLRTAADALAQRIGTGIELVGRRKDGSEFPIEIMLSPLDSLEGILVTAAIRNISVRKKSEEHLVKKVAELKRSNDELEKFASVASHDLQEPLRMVASFTQLLAKRYKGRLDSDADEFIAYAVDGSNRMKAVIQALLVYSRAGTNGKALHQISSESALQVAVANLRAAIEESGAVVTHDALPAVITDDVQLALVFQNLVGNAIKYHGPETPHVHVSATKNGGKEWIFSMRDNGMGIDPQYYEKIFILFQRLHGQKEFKGSGIGLAICKKILERLGGRIWVESQLEKGSTFYFALPERDGK
jgi:PAS domain S-box-containing protein